jgi:nucleoside-diphosphate-sugar epimerase/glycosyltransferase involved in cell wall biosynthesis
MKLLKKMNNLKDDIWTEAQKQDALNLKGPILIVGASGFVGAKLFLSLFSIRKDVYACSRNPHQSWRLQSVPKANLIALDITNRTTTLAVIEKFRFQTVFNLSAYGAYERQADAHLIYMTNFMGTFNLLNSLQKIGYSSFVQAGSSSEYGLNCTKPDEEGPWKPNSDYAVSKLSVSFLLNYFGKFLNAPVNHLRLYSVYGPYEDRGRLISNLVCNAIKMNWIPLADKKISRDFIYVDDATYAFVRAALSTCLTHPGESFNIASGIGTTLEELARLASNLFNMPNDPKFSSFTNRKWDLTQWYGSPQKANLLMQWKSQVSLEKGLALTAEWEKIFIENKIHIAVPNLKNKISIILACYKDNLAIPILHQRIVKIFENLNYEYEVIFVNDSSPFNDEEEIQKITKIDPNVIGITHSRNFGSQSAFLSGMAIATGNCCILMDGDGQDIPELIPKFIEKWELGFEVIYGERIKREAGIFMKIAYKLFYRIFKKLAEINIPLDAGDFSLIDRRVMNHLLSLPENDIFLRGLRAWVGFKQVGVPYVRPERLFGKTTNSFFKNIWWAKKGIFSFSSKPLNYMQSFGVLLILLCSTMSVYYIFNFYFYPNNNVHGFTSLALLILGLGGIQIFSVSIIGDYIGKILEEVKRRPKYIRKRFCINGNFFENPNEIEDLMEELNEKRKKQTL